MLTRRQFVTGAAATTVGLALPVRWALSAPGPRPASGAGLPMFVDPLPVPGTVDLRSGGAHHFGMGPGQHSFHRDLDATTTWGYGGAAYLGPTFEAQRGVPVDLTWHSGLGAHPFAAALDEAVHGTLATDATDPRAAVHLHGGNVATDDDAAPRRRSCRASTGPTTTTTIRTPPPSGTTTTPWASPG
jgi:FtsP/CotA-like multicopper oxidase with cupredoxin domain